MAVVIRRRRLINPQRAAVRRPLRKTTAKRTRRAAPRRAKRRTNPAQLLTLGLVNPTRRKRIMTRKKKAAARRRKNPTIVVRSAAKPKRLARRRNPSVASKPIDFVKTGAAALVGLVATRQVPQMLLGTRNTGVIGYAANIATTLAAAAIASRTAGKPVGVAVAIGGSMYLVNRLLNEHLSPAGRLLSLSGVGDAQAAGQLGVVRPGYFPIPVLHDQAGRPQIPQAIVEAARPALPPASPAGMAGVAANRYGGR